MSFNNNTGLNIISSRMSVLLVGLILACEPANAARGRPYVDATLGFNRLLTDQGSLLRGVSLSFDGGDPYGSLAKTIPSQESLNALATDYGLNMVHLYLEGNSSMNPNFAGQNAADADLLVQRTADAGLYLVITIGNNGENGSIHSMDFATDFWEFYAPRYKDESHVLFEAHNEPVAFSLNQWTDTDWDRQITLYNTIRDNAPDTFILLGSFMGFAGDPRYGANYLAARGVDWSNAGFAHHGYESKQGIENALSLIQSDLAYPATLATEFFPGDTVAQGYNSLYESYQNGWAQFQWLGADDEDLHDFRSKINAAGTIWTPDDESAVWPARGRPEIPGSGMPVGIYSRDSELFLTASPQNGRQLAAEAESFTGGQHDWFIVDRVDEQFISLRASNGLYVSAADPSAPLVANKAAIGVSELFELIQLANGDIALRASAGGQLIRRDSGGMLYADGNSGFDASSNFVVVAQPNVRPDSLVGAPFRGLPASVPGRIQAEDFDYQRAGAGYFDTDANNQGGKYRTLEAVDIEATTDEGGGYNVGWLTAGDWMEYTVNVDAQTTEEFILTARVATTNAGGFFRFLSDGSDLTGIVAVPDTGGWQNWVDVSATVELDPGNQIIRFSKVGPAQFNFNFFSLTPVATTIGDFNRDGIVDAADYTVWRDLFGSTSDLTADANLDGRIDGDDYLIWSANYGDTLRSTIIVPEPRAIWLVIAICPVANRRYLRRSPACDR